MSCSDTVLLYCSCELLLFIGAHVEGPFISYDKRGAHQEDYLQTMNNGIQDLLDVYGSLDTVSIVTLAVEMPGAMTVVPELVKRGIKVSLGRYMHLLGKPLYVCVIIRKNNAKWDSGCVVTWKYEMRWWTVLSQIYTSLAARCQCS